MRNRPTEVRKDRGVTSRPVERTWFEVAHAVAADVVPQHADWLLVHVREPVLAAVRSRASSLHAEVAPPEVGEGLEVVVLRHRDADLEAALNALVAALRPQVGEAYGSGRVTLTGVTRRASHVDPAHLRAIAWDEQELGLLQQLDLGAAVIAPLVAGDLVLGAVNVVRSARGGLDDEDQQRAEQLGRSLGEALARSLPTTAAMPGPRPVQTAARYIPTSAGNPVAAARRWARRTVPELLHRPVGAAFVSDLDLVVSELAGNALRHAGGIAAVTLEASAEGVRVGVADAQQRMPVRRDPDQGSTSGRGVLLWEALGLAWGTEHDLASGGKTVWVLMAAESDT